MSKEGKRPMIDALACGGTMFATCFLGGVHRLPLVQLWTVVAVWFIGSVLLAGVVYRCEKKNKSWGWLLVLVIPVGFMALAGDQCFSLASANRRTSPCKREVGKSRCVVSSGFVKREVADKEGDEAFAALTQSVVSLERQIDKVNAFVDNIEMGLSALEEYGDEGECDVPSIQGGRARQRYRCDHVRLKSAFGISDAVLADASRFPVGRLSSHEDVALKLEKPFLGCGTAYVRVEDAFSHSPRPGRTKIYHLASVLLKRAFPADTSPEAFLAEAKSTVGGIAQMLAVKAPDIELCKVKLQADETPSGARRRSVMRLSQDERASNATTVSFALSGCGKIDVVLREGTYVIRGGRHLPISPFSIEINIEFPWNWDEIDCDEIDRRKSAVGIDIGDEDCSEKLSKAMCDLICEQPARRLPPKDGE